MGNTREILDRSEAMLHKGIEEINQKGELNASTLELLGDALDALMDIEKIRGMQMGGGYERYEAYGRRRRDSMGRFTDDGYGRRYNDGGYGDGYGAYMDRGYRDGGYGEGGYRESGYRDGGYSDGGYGERGGSYGDDKREERERIERKMRNAQSEQERDMYRRMLEKL